ncbi:MAG: hypothetical protein HQ508_03685 [Candidatus Marinimicrobia bacterium]|nr:hypothetical protein [Candidatus Neomarinimicrobiota bacterium]
MSYTAKICLTFIIVFVIFNCASKSPSYDLPSAGTVRKPEWVGTYKAARDTIFIVIQMPNEQSRNLDLSAQKAQSELHTILVSELETILRDYWEEKHSGYTDNEQFKLISELPMTLEEVMKHVDVVDAWEKEDEVSILCALDYEEIADIVMKDMEIEDQAFLSYFMRRMDELAKRYN